MEIKMAHGGARKGAGRKPGKVSQAKRTIAEMAREHGELALQTLVDVASDPEAPHSSKVSAANALLDRGFGRPIQTVDNTSSDGTMSPKPAIDATKLKSDTLEDILNAATDES